jgi:hypothetical protein
MTTDIRRQVNNCLLSVAYSPTPVSDFNRLQQAIETLAEENFFHDSFGSHKTDCSLLLRQLVLTSTTPISALELLSRTIYIIPVINAVSPYQSFAEITLDIFHDVTHDTVMESTVVIQELFA